MSNTFLSVLPEFNPLAALNTGRIFKAAIAGGTSEFQATAGVSSTVYLYPDDRVKVLQDEGGYWLLEVVYGANASSQTGKLGWVLKTEVVLTAVSADDRTPGEV